MCQSDFKWVSRAPSRDVSLRNVWNFGDGVMTTNRVSTSHAWSAPGIYPVVLTAYNESNPGGVSATVVVHVVEYFVHYVSLGSVSPSAPYSSWETAATNINDAVNLAFAGDLILVTNGIYRTGGIALHGTMTNRVVLNKPVRVQSVNGPEVTIIEGCQVPGVTNGDGAIRCAYLTNGAVLNGFTLTNGATRAEGEYPFEVSGGGVWSVSTDTVVTNCILTANSACYDGGGAYQGTLNNCTLVGNSANYSGGGAYNGTLNNCRLTGNIADSGGGVCSALLNNCTLTGNSANYGGGVSGGTLRNCIVYYNTAIIEGANYTYGDFNYCCTTPRPEDGTGNISVEPGLATASHLFSVSPCLGTGSAAYATGTDIDGEPWLNPPSIGCDEYYSGSATGPLAVATGADWTNVTVGFTVALQGFIEGRASLGVWDFGDGIVSTNFAYPPSARHSWAAPGTYPVVLTAYNHSNPGGVSATVTVQVVTQPIHYVSAG